MKIGKLVLSIGYFLIGFWLIWKCTLGSSHSETKLFHYIFFVALTPIDIPIQGFLVLGLKLKEYQGHTLYPIPVMMISLTVGYLMWFFWIPSLVQYAVKSLKAKDQ